MEDIRRDFKHDVIRILESNAGSRYLNILLDDYHPYDISRAIIDIDTSYLESVTQLMSDELWSEVFEFLSVNEVKSLMPYFDIKRLGKIIDLMELDTAVDLLIGLESSDLNILKYLSPKKRLIIKKTMAYNPDDIGAYLNDSCLTIDIDFNVKQAMKHMTEEAHRTDYISILYVLDHQSLVGYIRLKDLIAARASEKIKDIMEVRFPQVYVNDDVETVAKIMQETKESSIPIIDESNHLLGVVTHDDLLEIYAMIEEEDYTKFAGLSDIEEDINTLTVRQSVKSRLPWLTILLFLSMGTSFILSLFDARLANSGPILAARLAVFLPLILDMAGNTGTQSLAVTIRYLSKNEDVEKQMFKQMILREFRTGLIQGLLIGTIVFGMILITTLWSKDALVKLDYIYALVTSMSVLIALIVSTTLGGLIPMVLHRLKFDPAVASGPFITTVSDIITLTIYYAIGMSILLPLY